MASAPRTARFDRATHIYANWLGWLNRGLFTSRACPQRSCRSGSWIAACRTAQGPSLGIRLTALFGRAYWANGSLRRSKKSSLIGTETSQRKDWRGKSSVVDSFPYLSKYPPKSLGFRHTFDEQLHPGPTIQLVSQRRVEGRQLPKPGAEPRSGPGRRANAGGRSDGPLVMELGPAQPSDGAPSGPLPAKQVWPSRAWTPGGPSRSGRLAVWRLLSDNGLILEFGAAAYRLSSLAGKLA